MLPVSPAADFIIRVRQWAATQPDILGLALVGSHARGTARPDSDIDLILIVPDWNPFLQNDAWINQFGPVERMGIEDWGGVQSRRVFYRDGIEVEFSLGKMAWVRTDPVDPGTLAVIRDGLQILYDPHQLFTQLKTAAGLV